MEGVALKVLRLAKARNQSGEFGTVLLAKRGKFQSESCAWFGVAHHGVGADLALRNKKIEPRSRAGWASLRCFDEQSTHAHVAD